MDLGVYTTNVTLLAAVGGFAGALRTALADRDGPAAQRWFDVIVGTLAAMAFGEYFTPDSVPKLGLFTGLVAGSVTDVALDMVRQMSPAVLRGWLEQKTGYRDKDE